MGKIILRLDRVMADRKMSLNELSEKVGVSNVMMSRYIQGKSVPSAIVANRIARALGCRLNELFDETYMN